MVKSERAGLPPGPWQAVWPWSDVLESIVDSSGQEVVSVYGADDSLAMSPEVLRAIEALPLLVEAARGVLEEFSLGALAFTPYRADVRTMERWGAFCDALARVDGGEGGGAGERGGTST